MNYLYTNIKLGSGSRYSYNKYYIDIIGRIGGVGLDDNFINMRNNGLPLLTQIEKKGWQYKKN